SIDPIYFNRTYYLEPEERGQKAYSLLAKVMRETGLAAITKFVMRRNEYLAVAHVMDSGVIALTTLYFAQDIRGADDIELEDIKVEKKEMELAEQLVSSLTAEFQPEKYTNEYVERLEELIE